MREAPCADTMGQVRLLIYNIRYATGTGPAFHLPVPGAGYLRSNRTVLAGITDFIKRQDPDVVGLIEVDIGSIRTGMVNQADFIARFEYRGQLYGSLSKIACEITGTRWSGPLFFGIRKPAK